MIRRRENFFTPFLFDIFLAYGSIAVTLEDTVDIGFFQFGSFPIVIKARASGRSEVYYK